MIGVKMRSEKQFRCKWSEKKGGDGGKRKEKKNSKAKDPQGMKFSMNCKLPSLFGLVAADQDGSSVNLTS